jgi:nucleotide-binding universal stress UspA family protein
MFLCLLSRKNQLIIEYLFYIDFLDIWIKGGAFMTWKILLATDGSPFSLKAADVAIEFAQKNSAEVEVIYVTPFTLFTTEYGFPVPQPSLNEIAQKIIDRTVEKFGENNIPYKFRIENGDPADRICNIAEEENINLIIIGTSGQTGINRFLLGSVSAKVVRHAPCSVMVIR